MIDLDSFAGEVGAEGPVTIAGLGTRGGAVPGVRCVSAPSGIDWVQADEMTVCCGAGTPVDQLVAAQPEPATAPQPDQQVGPGETRVPDLHRLPMRAVREQLHAAGLLLEAHGSGVAVAQGPLAGAVVPKGTQVHVNFRRLSEATESVNAAAVEHP